MICADFRIDLQGTAKNGFLSVLYDENNDEKMVKMSKNLLHFSEIVL